MLKEEHWVEKSRALVWAKLQSYSAGELKVLDTYLSRIDARRPDSALVTFTKKEYTTLMGIDPSMKTSRLKAYTKGLLGNVVTIDLPNDGYVQYPLFSMAECVHDKKTNQTIVKIACNERLLSAFFELAEDGYVRYQLKNTISLNSQYSIRLYTILKDKHFSWTAPVDTLKEALGAMSPAYMEFKNFNRLVLQRAIREINSVTDINVETENVKKGRSVAFVKFKITHLNMEYLPEPAEPTEPASSQPASAVDVEGLPKFLQLSAEVLPDSLSAEEIAVLHRLATDHVPFEMDMDANLMNIRKYLEEKVLLMKASKKPVKQKGQYGWLKRAVEEDW